MNNPKMIMLCGLPGSGKSTCAKELSEEISANIFSSDAIRKELFDDENEQEHNDIVFRELHKRIKENLRNSKNTIYDACNINSKRRRAFLSELKNIPCEKNCIIMATPYIDCLKQNENRQRIVPYDVISRMYKNWSTPYWFECWDNIYIRYDSVTMFNVQTWINNAMDVDQENSHHTLTLGQHCKLVGDSFADDKLLQYAGYLHDCGKPFVKDFINSKGEHTEDAHYYQHHCVGAYNSLFAKYSDGVNKLDVSILVNLHMYPYFWEKDKEHGEKTRNKYHKLWGDELYNNVMMLHEADIKAH